MKIAFASCFCSQISPSQPVWSWIQAHQPDYLVLLGDSIYLDIHAPMHPMAMTDDQFAKHLYARYRSQMQVPEFATLARHMGAGKIFSIWDDHDFLWNDQGGVAALAAPHSREKVMLSTAYQAAFRQALATGLADGSFPSQYNTAQLWDFSSFPLATPSVDLGSGVFLHLTDGRTHRTGKWGVSYADRTILGAAQRQAVGQVYANSPTSSIHLFASGSVLGDYCKSYPTDWDWMLATTGVRRTLALSGDIHRNAQAEFAGTQFPLYEATSSGAGVKELVVFGNDCQNYGVVELDASHVNIQLFAHNALEPHLRRRIVRSSWALG